MKRLLGIWVVSVMAIALFAIGCQVGVREEVIEKEIVKYYIPTYDQSEDVYLVFSNSGLRKLTGQIL
jgi:hypothetical protein